MRKTIVMKPTKIDESDLDKLHFPLYVQPKLDGVRCQARIPTSPASPVELYSSTGLPFKQLQHLKHALADMKPGIVLDGELMHPDGFQVASGIVRRTTEPHPREQEITYYIFDAWIEGIKEPFGKRLQLLQILRTDVVGLPWTIVPTYYVWDKKELLQLYQEFLEGGYEGIIIRLPENIYEPKRSKTIFKMKPTKTLIGRIIGWSVEMSKDGIPKGTVGAFLVEWEGKKFSVGSGLTAAQRALYVIRPPMGKKVKVKYQNLTDDGLPRFPVFVEIIE